MKHEHYRFPSIRKCCETIQRHFHIPTCLRSSQHKYGDVPFFSLQSPNSKFSGYISCTCFCTFFFVWNCKRLQHMFYIQTYYFSVCAPGINRIKKNRFCLSRFLPFCVHPYNCHSCMNWRKKNRIQKDIRMLTVVNY